MNSIRNKIQHLMKTGAFHIILGTFATKFVTFFGSIVVVKALSKEQYGMVGYVENIYGYIFLLAGMGIANAVLRYIVKGDDLFEKRKYFNYIFKRGLVIDICLCILATVVNTIVVYPEEFSGARKWVYLIIFLVPFQDVLNIGLFSIRALFKNQLYAYLSIILSAILILGRYIGAIVGNVGGVLSSRVIINAAFSIGIVMYVAVKLLPKNSECKIDKDSKKEINIFGIQFMITNGIWAMLTLNDTFLLGQITGDLELVADYKVAFVIPGALSVFSTAIGTYVGPYFVKHEDDRSWIQRNFKKVYVVTAFGLLGVSFLLMLFSKLFIHFLYGEAYYNVVPLMRGLILVAFVNCGLRFNLANTLSALGKVKYNMVVSFTGMLLQVLLDIVFINKFGVMGVVYSNLIAYLYMAVMLMCVFYSIYYSKKR